MNLFDMLNFFTNPFPDFLCTRNGFAVDLDLHMYGSAGFLLNPRGYMCSRND
jgi:hypothetical protein